MAPTFLRYPLCDGYIHNWLIAGPQLIPLDDPEDFHTLSIEGVQERLTTQYSQTESGVVDPPIQKAKLLIGDSELTWEYVCCLDDHLVNLSGMYRSSCYLRSWAYVEIESASAQASKLVLQSSGTADIWLNDHHIYRVDQHSVPRPEKHSIDVTLIAGINHILVRTETVAFGPSSYTLSLQLVDFAHEDSNPVSVPIAVDAAKRYHLFEDFFSRLYFDRDVYSHDSRVILRWPRKYEAPANYTVRLQQLPRRIYAEAQGKEKDSADRTFLQALSAPNGEYEAILMPDAHEFYSNQVQIEQRFPLTLVRTQYSLEPYGTYPERRTEAVKEAAMRRDGLFAEIAKMAGNWWADVKAEEVLDAIEQVNQREVDSILLLTGLLGMLYRFGEHPTFPTSIQQPLESSLLGFLYGENESGFDLLDREAEGHQILFYTCETLAGQRYPDATFANSGQTGAWHRQQGEEKALAWLQQRAAYGFESWGSGTDIEQMLMALSHLLDLAESEAVWGMAAAVMDKIFVTLALNSHKGVLGSSQGCADALSVKSGHLAPTAGISRLLWGQGTWNLQLKGVVSLACCENYQLPEIIGHVASQTPNEVWATEFHAGEDASENHSVHKASYRTSDYLLASAQDYRPGQLGCQEHIWQATIDPDTVVFTNHPASMDETNAHTLGFWRGNGVLPRVAQWQDRLIAIYKLPDEDTLGFTHAYFPTFAFDEYQRRKDWIFGRKGEAYVALASSQKMELIRQGRNAYRELRAYGQESIWLCQMGRKSDYGTFANFQKKILGSRVRFDGLSVLYRVLGGDKLTFGWDAPLNVNDEIPPQPERLHYNGPHCVTDSWPASMMIVAHGEQALRIDLG